MAAGSGCLIPDFDRAVLSQEGEEAHVACCHDDHVSYLEGRPPFSPLRSGSVPQPDRARGGPPADVSRHMFFIELPTAQHYQVSNTDASNPAQQIAEIAAEVLDSIRGGR